ncbi:DUF6716 putative glycosyltransferase [Parenemella sanctibonifatiensis]|uniref:Uncharacterized protein n=1 Tax=Parenemella sanctibonifatiensis TaxID=2016505 RepID=A0A255E4V7_9ACTN|nr:DUF6716 putative glycosyltransferase [Parenemella sanctibonifatiensis]OYN86589.1 hypothetical protein CGZ92_09680 [Parenemella sanctibonifatiensis]
MTRVVAVADSDSYLKLADHLLAQLPADWQTELAVVANPVQPSPAQTTGLTTRPVATVGVRRWTELVAEADVVLLSCTGPAMMPLLRRLRSLANRPVLVSALPGISLPANDRAVWVRSQTDLLVVNSHREREAFRGHRLAEGLRVGLGHLPQVGSPAPRVEGDEVVFAAQSLVPAKAEQRRAVLATLGHLSDPWRAVLKVRALGGERQTHNERWPYPQLLAALEQEGAVPRGSIEVRAGSMQQALGRAGAMVTVSSTAALEAITAGVPVAVINDFGVSDDLINPVFEGSGLFTSLAQIRAGWFPAPDPAWLEANYFHDVAADDWTAELDELVAQRGAGELPQRPLRPEAMAGRLRQELRLAPPGWLWQAARRIRR